MDTDNRGVVHYEAIIYLKGKRIWSLAEKDCEALEAYIKNYYKKHGNITYDIFKVTTERELINLIKI